VAFTPLRAGMYSCAILVESGGRFREVNLVGLGGVLSVDYPDRVALGPRPAGQWSEEWITLTNTGEVTLRASLGLDRRGSAIQAEPNSDSEEGEQEVDGGAEGAGSDGEKEERSQSPISSEAQGALARRDGASPSPASLRSRSRALLPSSSRSSSSSALFAVKLSPRRVVVPPLSSARVLVRLWVPPASAGGEGPFAFQLWLRLPEATLSVQLQGVGTVVRLSELARSLLERERDNLLSVARAPHPFASKPLEQAVSLSASRAVTSGGLHSDSSAPSAASSVAPSRRASVRASDAAAPSPDPTTRVASQVPLENAPPSGSANVARAALADVSADLLCPPHAPFSVVPAQQARIAGISGTSYSTGKAARQQGHDQTDSPPSLEAQEAAAVAARLDALERSLAAAAVDADEDRDGLLLGVLGVTHLAPPPLLATDQQQALLQRDGGEDDVARQVLRCEPSAQPAMQAPSHAALLRPVEPRGPEPRALALLPALLAQPPIFLDELGL